MVLKRLKSLILFGLIVAISIWTAICCDSTLIIGIIFIVRRDLALNFGIICRICTAEKWFLLNEIAWLCKIFIEWRRWLEASCSNRLSIIKPRSIGIVSILDGIQRWLLQIEIRIISRWWRCEIECGGLRRMESSKWR